MAEASPHAPSPRAERTRQRLLDAAGQCFAASGFAKTTVEEIAAAAGVSKGLVYHHFRSKDQILQAVLERTLRDWTELSLHRLQESARDKGALEALAEMHRASLEYARDNPVVRALFQLDPLVFQGLGSSAAVRAVIEPFRVALVRVLEQGIDSGELRPSLDVERAADVVRLLNMGFIDQILNPEWIDAADPRLIEASIDVLFHGLAREDG